MRASGVCANHVVGEVNEAWALPLGNHSRRVQARPRLGAGGASGGRAAARSRAAWCIVACRQLPLQPSCRRS